LTEIWQGILWAAATGEIAVLGAAGFVLYRSRGSTVAEAISCAIVTLFMALSFLFQTSFLVGQPVLSRGLEAILCGGALWIVASRPGPLHSLIQGTRSFLREAPFLLAGSLVLASLLLVTVALTRPPSSQYWDVLAQLMLLEQSGSVSEALADFPRYPLFPLNTLILNHHFLRFSLPRGVVLFPVLAYLSIGFSTYALARRHAWPPTAFTVALVVLGMPRLVFQIASPGTEILPAAVGLFCLLALFRALEQHRLDDFALLVLGILFTVSPGPMGGVFPAILCLLSAVTLFRRHGGRVWGGLLARHPLKSAAALAPALVFSQGWLLIYNRAHCGRWAGIPQVLQAPGNPDGLQGALANLARYALQAVHFPPPVDAFFQWAAGFRLSAVLTRIHDLYVFPILGPSGTAVPFKVSWDARAATAWFGPLAFLLVVPALLYSLRKGSRRLKAVSLALAGYVYLAALVPAWTPRNGCFFTVFFVCAGFCVAFFLPPWRFTTAGKRGLQVLALGLFLITCLSMLQKPPCRPRKCFGDERVEELGGLLPPGSRIPVFFSDLTALYPYLVEPFPFRLAPQSLASGPLKDEKPPPKASASLCVACEDSTPPSGFRLLKAWPARDAEISAACVLWGTDG